MRIIKSDEEFLEFIEASSSVVCFVASWCGDCHFIQPYFPEMEKEYSAQTQFAQLDIDDLPEPAARHQVTGIPSFIIFKDGKEIYRFVNSRRKTKEEVKDFLDKGLALG